MTRWRRLSSLERWVAAGGRPAALPRIADLTDLELARVIAHGTDLLPEQVLAFSDTDLSDLLGTLQARVEAANAEGQD
jgi:hypothetical protein